MAKPWEAFQSQETGPWTQFQSQEKGPWTQFQKADEEEEDKQPLAEVPPVETADPEEKNRARARGVYGLGVLDLFFAPHEKDPRIGAVARAATLTGSGIEAAARLANIAPDTVGATAPAVEAIKTISPQLQKWADGLKNWGEEFGYSNDTELGDIAENPAKIVPFIIERATQSLPDMVAATLALPAYIPALANEILNQRLENDGRTIEQATISDVTAATAAAVLQGPLERFATRGLFQPRGILGQTALQAGTEAVQETGQYAAETAGTQVGFDPRQAGLVALEAAIVGGGVGGTAATVSTLEQNAIRRDIEGRIRRGEDVRSEEEMVELDRIRDQALENAKDITVPELQADPLRFGTDYSEIIYDSVGQYIPINEEFKVEERTVDDAPRFVVTDRSGTQYGQALENSEQANAFAEGLNNTTQKRAAILEDLYPLKRSLSEVMKGYGLNDISVSLDRRIFTRRGEELTSEGIFDPVTREIFLAVDAIDPDGSLDTNQRREALRGVLRHEVVHALRYMDLWKKSEWKNLERTVSRLKKPGTDKTYLEIASERYADQTPVIQVEEGVAELIRDVAGNLSNVGGQPRSLSERAIQFFDRAKNALTGAGFQTYEDIVNRVEKGIVGSRRRGRIRTLRATEEQMGYQGIVPERIQPLFINPNERNQAREEVVQKAQEESPATSQPAINSVRLNAVRQSRSNIERVPEEISVDERRVPSQDSEGRLIYSGYEGPEVFGIQTKPTEEGLQNFWRWFGNSKTVDSKKRPLVFYHGTAADITEFRPKQAGSVFITRSPKFAESFSFLSDNYIVSNFPDFMSDQQVLEVLDETLASPSAFSPALYDTVSNSRDQAVADVQEGKAIRSDALKSLKDIASQGRSSRYLNAIQKRLPSSANLMPVYVKANNPFDYENTDHVKQVLEEADRISAEPLSGFEAEGIFNGDWGVIETPKILDAIKNLGFDSMYVEEQGEKNLAVFEPNQIKSAVGNNGDFSPLTPSIREARVRNPLEDIVSPEEAEGRIRRRLAREPGVGAPRNERTEITATGKTPLVVGRVTTEDWLNRVRTLMSMDEIQDARGWYRQLDEAFRPIFGEETPKYALAWLLSQKRASPTKGFTDVLRAADLALGKPEVKKAGLNQQALIDVLKDRVPEGGIGAKLLDFLDSELGLDTRTVVRGDVRGRQPAAIDVWAQRDIGFVDETVQEFIRKNFGDEAANRIQVDKTTSGETQYEYGIDFYNDVAEMLNRQNFDGGGWTASEVQAVGWVTMQRAMGVSAEFVRDIIGGNTRRISIGLAPGANSILSDKLAGKEIPVNVAQREIDFLADLAGIRVKQNVAGVGAYLQWLEGAIQLDAIASPEAVNDFMDMVGYVFQQTEVINTRPLPSGKNMAIDFLSPNLDSVDNSTKFFSKFLELSPKDREGNPIAPGFQQILIDGMPGIRLLNFGGKWRRNDVDKIISAANKAADETGVKPERSIVSQVVLSSTKNDWKENRDGEAFLGSLRDRGRLQEVELLQRRYPPSRIDLAGDGSIVWKRERKGRAARGAAAEEAVTPRARESRLTGPASVTEPGPTTDVDTTAAAEALNEGQPVNSLGIPVGPLLTYTMPDGTVAPRIRESRRDDPIRGAKIDPIMRRLLRGIEFIESAPDKLRRGVGLQDIASRIENYYDTYDARLGEVNGIIREFTKNMSRSELRSAQETFEQYIRERENNRTEEAEEILRNATENDRQLILAWQNINNVTGRVNKDVRDPNGKAIQVWDTKLKKGKGDWRDIGTVKDFFPRALRKDVLELMMNPETDPVLYNQLLDSLVESGKAKTREEAEDFLLKDYFTDEIKNDYFAGLAKARDDALPEIFYDYSWDAATRYLSKWARRTSQIEYFGQDLGPTERDWFDTNIKLIRNRDTQEYLNQIKNRIYEVETFGTWVNLMKWSNQLATALQLGNPASAFLNLVGGDVANIQMYGWKEVAKAHAALILDWKKIQEEGTRLGILNKDYLRIVQDGIERDAGKYFATDDKVSVALAKFAETTLTFGGFNGAENIVRATAMMAARGFLDSSLKAIDKNPNSSKSKKFIDFIKRENLDLDKLILENGAGPETNKFLRRGVNVPQGSYRIDMTPVFVDTNVGRFFFKYQKFGTQINRFFYRNFLKPWMDDPTDTIKFLRLLAFLFPAIFGGEILNQFRRFLGYGGDYGPTYAQISKAFEKDETAKAWGLIFSRSMQNVSVAGSFGFVGNYYQFGKDVMDQQRVKNPMNPPGLASLDALIDVGYRLLDQGKLTARDLDEIAEKTMSFYRANKRIALAGMSELGVDAKEVKRFAAQRDLREIRRYGLRYAQDMDIEGKRQRSFSGPPVRTELTPTNNAIVNALYQGNASEARVLIRQATAGKSFSERQKINQSIRASIRNRQPIQIGNSAPNNEERRAFLRWARQNLSAEEYQKISTMDRTYRRAADRIDMGFGD